MTLSGKSGIGRGLLVPLAPALALIGAIPAFYCPLEEALRTLAAFEAVAVVQILLILASGRRLSRRVADLAEEDPAAAAGLARAFPASLVARLALATAALGGAALAGACLGLSGDGVAKLVGHEGAVFVALQAMYLLPVHRVARLEARRLLARTGGADRSEERRRDRSAVAAFFGVLVVPAAVASLCLAIAAEEVVSRASIEGTAGVYSRVAEAVLGSPPLPVGAGGASHVENLTRFDGAIPFVVSAEGSRVGGPEGPWRDGVEAAIRRDPSGAMIGASTDWAAVWAPLGDGRARVGVHLTVGSDPRMPFIVVALLLVAAFGSALIAILRGSRIPGEIAYLAARMDAIPDGEGPPARPALGFEFALVDEEIDRLSLRFEDLRSAQETAIESGRRSRETKAQVFASVSHDLRSPLNSVIGFTDLLLKGIDGELGDEQRKAVQRIAQGSERLLVLINDILESAKLEAGELELDREWVPSVEILTECEAAARRLVATRNIRFESELQPGLPPVHVDKERLLAALLSLIARIVDLMDSGKVKLVSSRGSSSSRAGVDVLRISIVETGRAVPRPERDRLVEVFRTISATAEKDDAGGAGLALSLARRVVSLHGGTIDLEKGERGGSVFTVEIPLDDIGAA